MNDIKQIATDMANHWRTVDPTKKLCPTIDVVEIDAFSWGGYHLSPKEVSETAHLFMKQLYTEGYRFARDIDGKYEAYDPFTRSVPTSSKKIRALSKPMGMQ